ncbi:MAG: hypothetical protein JWL88_129 [Parcubacteria group bacterium]|nr:hypothetical protein [Parcubacteria group bacterium]
MNNSETVLAPKRPMPLWNTFDNDILRCTSYLLAPTPEDIAHKGQYSLESGRSRFARRLAEELEPFAITDAYFLNSTVDNTKLIRARHLTTKTILANGTMLHSNVNERGQALLIERISKPISALQLAAGCGLGVILHRDCAWKVHISSRSMIDHERLNTGRASRPYETILHAIADDLDLRKIPRSSVKMQVSFLQPGEGRLEPLDDPDPVKAAFHRRLYDDLNDRGLNDNEDVMRASDGRFSLKSLVYKIGYKELGFGSVRSVSPLPLRPPYGNTRVPGLEDVRNIEFSIIELIS